ncbi:MAG: ABC transporter permease [Candidatus Woesearchaeota archaeon]
MILDYFVMGFRNIRRRKLRSWLTMIGIFIGIAAVVALVSLGQGLQKYVNEEFEKLGRDKILVMPKSPFGPIASDVYFTKKNIGDVKNVVGVADAAGMYFNTVRMEYNDQVKYIFAVGIPTDESRRLVDELFLSYDVELGRNIKKGDNYKVVCGHYFLDNNIFKPNLKVGDKVLINDKQFDVVGFLEIIGNPSDDSSIYLPEDALFELYDIKEPQYGYVIAKVANGVEPRVGADRIEKALRKSRGLKEGSEDFTISTTEELMDTYNTILNIVQYVLVGIALISLVVGGIGIMNTMYTAVLERTKEIGILKAVGARNRDILGLFLIESGTLGLVGGAIGVALGVLFSKLVEFAATAALQSRLLQAYFPWYLVVGALGFSFIVGTLSGLLPAYQASKQKPVDALRYE